MEDKELSLMQRRREPGGCLCEETDSNGVCKACGCHVISLAVGVDFASKDRVENAVLALKDKRTGQITVDSFTPEAYAKAISLMFGNHVVTEDNGDGSFTHTFVGTPIPPQITHVTAAPVITALSLQYGRHPFADIIYRTALRLHKQYLKRRKRARLRARGFVPSGRPHKRRK